MLRILFDQNIPSCVCESVRALRPLWEVLQVDEAGLHGATDERIFRWAQEGGWIVVTFDEDFADARMYPAGTHAGAIRLRVWPTTIEVTEAALKRLLASIPDDELPGSLVIVDDRRIRIRRWIRHG